MALWGGRFSQGADSRFKQFNDSLRFDYRLAEQDIQGSMAWAKALVKVGVLTSDVDKVIRLSVAGLTVGDYIDDRGDARNVTLTLPRDKFSNLDALKNLYVNNLQGTPIALNQIAEISFETSPTAINHFNKSRFSKVTALSAKGYYANDLLTHIVPKLDQLKMPKGYYYKLSGEKESEGDSLGGNFLAVIILSTFLFIAVLLLQFKTFKVIIIVFLVLSLQH